MRDNRNRLSHQLQSLFLLRFLFGGGLLRGDRPRRRDALLAGDRFSQMLVNVGDKAVAGIGLRAKFRAASLLVPSLELSRFDPTGLTLESPSLGKRLYPVLGRR